MAITKTLLNSVTYADGISDLYHWLLTESTEYFDNVELKSPSDANAYIRCTVGSAYIDIGQQKISHKIQLSSGAYVDIDANNTVPLEAIKTSYGLRIRLNGYNSNQCNFFIFKSNKGNTSVIMQTTSQSTYSNNAWYYADLISNTFIMNAGSMINKVLSSSYTVLSPLPLGNGKTIADGLFYTPFSEYKGTNATIEIDGIKYNYDGIFALQE